jgi:2-polyprenyl-3-methyl-5-hydroxy-6-metoxy-1,4-benzoquinol methylase
MQKTYLKFKIWSGKFFRIILRSFYGFDKWHLFTLTERIYAKDIIIYCNDRIKKNAFAEIGCGLGDIIRNVNYVEKLGFDTDINVLRAASTFARICFRKKIKFSVFHFPDSNLNGKFDVIVMVNWIHHVEPFILKSKIEQYSKLNLNNGGCIILDTVQDKEYRFNHNINYLAKDLNSTLTKLGDYERQRQVWAINK